MNDEIQELNEKIAMKDREIASLRRTIEIASGALHLLLAQADSPECFIDHEKTERES